MINEQLKRIAKILGVEELEGIDDDALDYTEQSMRKYLRYLMENVEHPCYLTGVMEFKWERSIDLSVKIPDYLKETAFILGIDGSSEYDDLKNEDRPSYTDTFELVSFDREIDPIEGILVAVQRVSDKKNFTLQLLYLKVTDQKSKNYRLFNDFSYWYEDMRFL